MSFTAVPTTTDANGHVVPTAQVKDPTSVAGQKDMFLGLLVAQLKNQDPTSPMDQKDMMAQMAQMTSVEQITNMATALKDMSTNATFSQSVGLIGKEVDYLGGTDGKTLVTNQAVTSVTVAAGKVSLVLEDGTRIGPTDVIRVS